MEQLPQNDHDLLVTIHGQVGRALTDIKELKDNVAERVNKLEDGKLNRSDFEVAKMESFRRHDDHENRIRTLTVNTQEVRDSMKSNSKTWGIVATILTLILGALELVLNHYK
jgi:hypothetical protein